MLILVRIIINGMPFEFKMYRVRRNCQLFNPSSVMYFDFLVASFVNDEGAQEWTAADYDEGCACDFEFHLMEMCFDINLLFDIFNGIYGRVF